MTTFKVPKSPWYVRLIGWWRRRQFEKQDRIKKLKELHTPIYINSIIGNTKWRATKEFAVMDSTNS